MAEEDEIDTFVDRIDALTRNIENTTGIYTLQTVLLNELLDISRMMNQRELDSYKR